MNCKTVNTPSNSSKKINHLHYWQIQLLLSVMLVVLVSASFASFSELYLFNVLCCIVQHFELHSYGWKRMYG